MPDGHHGEDRGGVGYHEQTVVVARAGTGFAGLAVLAHELGEDAHRLARCLGALEHQPPQIGELRLRLRAVVGRQAVRGEGLVADPDAELVDALRISAVRVRPDRAAAGVRVRDGHLRYRQARVQRDSVTGGVVLAGDGGDGLRLMAAAVGVLGVHPADTIGRG